MKVFRIIFVLLGLGLAAGGVYFVLYPPPGEEGIVQYIPAGAMFLFAVLMFTVWVPMLRGLDHGKLLRTGEPATATILEVRDANTTINEQPVFRFTLEVRRADGSTYQAKMRQIVSRPAIGSIRPGMVVPVRVDPRRPDRVAIDSRASATGGSLAGGIPADGIHGGSPTMDVAAAATAWAAGRIPTAGVKSAADLLRDGLRGTATLRSASLTGRTLGEVQPDRADPTTADDPLVLLVMEVTTADGRTVTAQGVHRVPKDQLSRLTPGVSLPVAYHAADPANGTCVDWERLAMA